MDPTPFPSGTLHRDLRTSDRKQSRRALTRACRSRLAHTHASQKLSGRLHWLDTHMVQQRPSESSARANTAVDTVTFVTLPAALDPCRAAAFSDPGPFLAEILAKVKTMSSGGLLARWWRCYFSLMMSGRGSVVVMSHAPRCCCGASYCCLGHGLGEERTQLFALTIGMSFVCESR